MSDAESEWEDVEGELRRAEPGEDVEVWVEDWGEHYKVDPDGPDYQWVAPHEGDLHVDKDIFFPVQPLRGRYQGKRECGVVYFDGGVYVERDACLVVCCTYHLMRNEHPVPRLRVVDHASARWAVAATLRVKEWEAFWRQDGDALVFATVLALLAPVPIPLPRVELFKG